VGETSPHIKLRAWSATAQPSGHRRRGPTGATSIRAVTGAIPYELCAPNVDLLGMELHLVPPWTLSSAVLQVVDVESPIHVEEVSRRIARAVDVHRVGHRILEAINQAAAQCVSRQQISRRGDYLWSTAMSEPKVRDRSRLDGQLKAIDHIAPEEIGAAVLMVAAQCHAGNPQDFVIPTSRLLGLKRAGRHIDKIVKHCVDSLVEHGGLVSSNGRLVARVPEASGSSRPQPSDDERPRSDEDDMGPAELSIPGPTPDSGAEEQLGKLSREDARTAASAAMKEARAALMALRSCELSGDGDSVYRSMVAGQQQARALDKALSTILQIVDEIAED